MLCCLDWDGSRREKWRQGDAEEIITNGKTGILVRPGNVRDLVEAINGVLSKEEENLKDMSLLQKQEFERKYTLEKYIFNHVLLYNSLLNKNKMTSFKMLQEWTIIVKLLKLYFLL